VNASAGSSKGESGKSTVGQINMSLDE